MQIETLIVMSLKQLYINNKMEHFSCKGGCGMTCIKHLKEELVWATDKQLCIIIKYLNYTTKELKNRVVLSLKQYCMCCYAVLSNIF